MPPLGKCFGSFEQAAEHLASYCSSRGSLTLMPWLPITTRGSSTVLLDQHGNARRHSELIPVRPQVPSYFRVTDNSELISDGGIGLVTKVNGSRLWTDVIELHSSRPTWVPWSSMQKRNIPSGHSEGKNYLQIRREYCDEPANGRPPTWVSRCSLNPGLLHLKGGRSSSLSSSGV